MLTLKYGVNLLMRPYLAYCVKMHAPFDCAWQRVNAFSHCVTLIRVLLSQMISYSDTKVPVLVLIECKCANVIYVYELIFLLHTSRSTECTVTFCYTDSSMWWSNSKVSMKVLCSCSFLAQTINVPESHLANHIIVLCVSYSTHSTVSQSSIYNIEPCAGF